MARNPATIRVKGLDRLERNLTDPKTLGAPMRKFFNRATKKMFKEAQRNMLRKLDTGRSASSLRRQVDGREIPRWGKIFSNYYVTKIREGRVQPFFPRVDGALRQWAESRGLDPWAVAVRISRRGLRAQRNFTRARFAARKKIGEFSKEAAFEIKNMAERL